VQSKTIFGGMENAAQYFMKHRPLFPNIETLLAHEMLINGSATGRLKKAFPICG
jgi:hypothetical protein